MKCARSPVLRVARCGLRLAESNSPLQLPAEGCRVGLASGTAGNSICSLYKHGTKCGRYLCEPGCTMTAFLAGTEVGLFRGGGDTRFPAQSLKTACFRRAGICICASLLRTRRDAGRVRDVREFPSLCPSTFGLNPCAPCSGMAQGAAGVKRDVGGCNIGLSAGRKRTYRPSPPAKKQFLPAAENMYNIGKIDHTSSWRTLAKEVWFFL